MSTPRALSLGLLAAALALAGCAPPAASAPDTGEPAIGAVPVIVDSVPLRLPIQDFMLTDAQQLQVGRAQWVLIGRCMKRFGYDYVVRPGPEPYGPRSLTDRRYGTTDAALAAADGYGLGARDPLRRPRPTRPALDADGRNALNGQGRSRIHGLAVPAGGCLGEAAHGIDRAAPAGADSGLPERLQFESYALSGRDSRVLAAIGRWSACMARSGYDYADPMTAPGDPRFAHHPSALETAVARADVACKAATNLVGVWFTVESAYQERQLAQHAEVLDATRKALDARLSTAAAILAENR
jgi:hypothetical protein